MNRIFAETVALVFAISLSSTLIFAAETEPAKPAAPAVEKNAAPPDKAVLVDINTATEGELKALPGIGEVHVKNIIANRPYLKKEELMLKGIIPGTVYELIKDRIKTEIKAER
jgi:DNA uptake protein ComE-like DNA-binding protein